MGSTVRSPRGRKRSRTRDEVITAALRLADRDGFDALSMPALARELHCGTMTLYSYVDDKGDLIDAVAQRGLEGLRLSRPLPDSAAEVLTAWGRALRAKLLDHPALAILFLSRPVIGEGILRGVDALLGALQRTGMEPSDGVRAIYAVLIYTAGFVAWETPRMRQQSPSTYSARWRALFASIPPGTAPLAETVQSTLTRVADEGQFELGLVALSQGLASPSRFDPNPVRDTRG